MANGNTPALDENQQAMLDSFLLNIGDNLIGWEVEYYAVQTPIMQCMERYNCAHSAFRELALQIRFMPDTKMICTEIVKEIAKVEQQAQLAYQSISNPAGTEQSDPQQLEIEERKE